MTEKKVFPEFLKIVSRNSMGKRAPGIQVTENETVYVADARLISLLREYFGFKFSVVTPEDNQIGQELLNGSWNGIVGKLHREEVDIAVGKLAMSESRANVIDFSYPYFYSSTTFLTDKPEYLPNTYAVVYPFSLTVWTAIALSLTTILLLTYVFKSKKDAHPDMLLCAFASLLQMSVNVKLHRLSTKLFMLSWIIGAMFITYSYKAVLLSFLTFPTATGIRNIKELSKASEESSFKCAMYPGSFILPSLLKSDEKSTKEIGECLRRNIPMFTYKPEEFLQPVTYKKAFIGTRIFITGLSKSYFLSDDSFFTVFAAIGIRKSFCCKDLLNDFIHRIAAVGLLDKIERDELFWIEMSFSDLKTEESNPNRRLTLEDVSAAFFFLGCGYILAALVLLGEVLFYKKQRNIRH